MPRIKLAPTKQPNTRAIGLQYHLDNVKTLPTGVVELELIPEPDNPYDERAISVRHQGRIVGYIPREETNKYWQSVARIARRKDVPVAQAEVRDIGNEWPLVYLYIRPGKSSLPANLQNSPAVKPGELPKAYKQTTALAYARVAKEPAVKRKNDVESAGNDARGKWAAASLVGSVALLLIGVPWPLVLGVAVGALYFIYKER